VVTSELAGADVDYVEFLSLLSDVNRRRLLARSTRNVYPAGTIAFRPDDPPRAFVVERGLVRVYWSVPDGRQATVAFSRTHELLGGTTIIPLRESSESWTQRASSRSSERL
jgi:CRP-like cAMP-binding protein